MIMTSILFKIVIFIEFLFHGYCQSIYTKAVFKNKTNRGENFALFLLAASIEFLVYQHFNNFIVNIISFIALSFIVCLVCCEARIGTILLHCFIMCIMLLLSETLVIPFSNYLLHDNYLQNHNQVSELLISTISKLLVFMVCIRVSQTAEKENIQTIDIYLFVIPMLSIFVINSVVSVLSDTATPHDHNMLILIISVSFIIINTVVFLIHEYNVSISNETERLLLLEQKKELDYEYYKLLRKNYDESRIMIHDIKHHINVLKQLSVDSTDTELKKYIDKLSENEFRDNRRIMTGSKIIDVVVYQKSELCKDRSIKFSFEPNNINFGFVEEPDICSILSNLLDNAIEAAEKSEEKTIRLVFHSQGKMYFIDIENSCDIEPHISNGRLITTKQGKNGHGMGMYSVEKILKKYKGDSDCEYIKSSRTFHISTMMYQAEQGGR